MLSAKTSSGWW